MPKKPKENLAIREAELRKIEDLNRREKKALEEKAELVRQRRELDSAEAEPDEVPADGVPFGGFADPGFTEVVQNLSSEGSVHVYLTTNSGLKKVAQFPVVDMSSLEQQMEKVAHEYGGGTFTIRILHPNGQIAKQKNLSYDEKAYAKAVDPSSQSSQMQDRLFQMMVESRRESTELLKTFLMAQASSKPASPFGNMTIADIVGLLKGNSGPVDFKSMSDLFTRALTMGREMAEGKAPSETGGEDNMLKDLVAPFLAVLQNITAKKPAPALPMRTSTAVVPSAPAMPPAPAPVPAETVQPKEEAAVAVDPSIQSVKSSFVYKLYVPTLLKAARDVMDPAEVAEDILNTVPEGDHGILLKLMENPDVVEYLAAFESVAREHAEWIKKVAAEVLAQYSDEESEESPEITPSENGHTDIPPSRLDRTVGV